MKLFFLFMILECFGAISDETKFSKDYIFSWLGWNNDLNMGVCPACGEIQNLFAKCTNAQAQMTSDVTLSLKCFCPPFDMSDYHTCHFCEPRVSDVDALRHQCDNYLAKSPSSRVDDSEGSRFTFLIPLGILMIQRM